MHILQEYISYFSNFAFSLFWFLVMLTMVVFIHEYGHYLFARLCGVKIHSFSLGFGRELFGWNDKHGTRWKFSILPLGGYVKMHGDADPASSPDFKKLKKLKIKDREQSFYYKSLPQKAAIVLAGPLANYLSAILIMWVMFAFYGQMVTSNEITMVQEGSSASKAGIQLGDKITKMDGEEIKYFEELKQIIILNSRGIATTWQENRYCSHPCYKEE